MPDRSPFTNGFQTGFQILGHRKQVVGTTSTGLENIPEPQDQIKRVVIHPQQAMKWTGDGTPATADEAFPALAGELLIYDGYPLEDFQMAAVSGTSTVYLIYMC